MTGVRHRRGGRHVHGARHARAERHLHRHRHSVRVVHPQAEGLALRAAPDPAVAGGGLGRARALRLLPGGRDLLGDRPARRRADGGPGPRAATQGTFGLIAAGFLIVCVAPAAEEFFFRGFFYKALRSRYSVLAAAAIDGGLFGLIHFDFSGTGRPADPPAARAARVHLLPGLREDGLDLPGDRDALVQQRDRLRGAGRRVGGVRGARAADAARAASTVPRFVPAAPAMRGSCIPAVPGRARAIVPASMRKRLALPLCAAALAVPSTAAAQAPPTPTVPVVPRPPRRRLPARPPSACRAAWPPRRPATSRPARWW